MLDNTRNTQVYYFAKTEKKGKKITFGIKEQDRFSHLLFVSKDTEKKRALLTNAPNCATYTQYEPRKTYV